MKTADVLKVVGGLVLIAVAWKGYKAATGAVSDAMDTIASLPGRALDAVTEAPPARIVDYSQNRNTDPLIAYFIRWGNTAETRASAYRAGWTADEISLAVLAMAQANGNQ